MEKSMTMHVCTLKLVTARLGLLARERFASRGDLMLPLFLQHFDFTAERMLSKSLVMKRRRGHELGASQN